MAKGKFSKVEFAAKIKAKQRLQFATQSDFADYLGVSPAMVSKVLQGKDKPTAPFLKYMEYKLEVVESYIPVWRKAAKK